MAIDVTAGEPGWHLKRMLQKLDERRPRYDLLEAHFTNEARIPHSADKAIRDAYRRLMQMSRTNFAELVVEAPRERQRPVGFRTGAAGDDMGDTEAWGIWQANSLDAESVNLFRTRLIMGDAYTIVGPVDVELGVPVITVEDPREVITEHDPIQRRKTLRAAKWFVDAEAGEEVAYLYLPGQVWCARRPASKKGQRQRPWNAGWEWDWADDRGLLPGRVTVHRFPCRQMLRSRPDGRGDTWGEFETHLTVLNRINYTVLNRLEIMTLQAFRQRALKGGPVRDEQGNEIDYDSIFENRPDAFWHLPQTAEIWESGQVDLSPIRASIKDDVQDLAASTRTPLFYLTPDAANGSAEGASLAREGLVFKTESHNIECSDPLEATMADAFAYMGDNERSKRSDMEVIWASPERFSLTERLDAASKAKAAGVPWTTRMSEILQYSPQEIARMRSRFPENVNPDHDTSTDAATAPL